VVPRCNHGEDYTDTSLPEDMVEILVAPTSKMMERAGNKSRLKDQTKILRERSRNFARDHEADEMISLNDRNNLKRSGFLNKDGKRRKKVDDI
jgi:hypothetical protein